MAIRHPIDLLRAGLKGSFWFPQGKTASSGCPIGFQQTAQFWLLSRRRTNHHGQTCETLFLLEKVTEEEQKQLEHKRRPHFTPHDIGVMDQEVDHLARLLEFLEKCLDALSAAVQISIRLAIAFQEGARELFFSAASPCGVTATAPHSGATIHRRTSNPRKNPVWHK